MNLKTNGETGIHETGIVLQTKLFNKYLCSSKENGEHKVDYE